MYIHEHIHIRVHLVLLRGLPGELTSFSVPSAVLLTLYILKEEGFSKKENKQASPNMVFRAGNRSSIQLVASSLGLEFAVSIPLLNVLFRPYLFILQTWCSVF